MSIANPAIPQPLPPPVANAQPGPPTPPGSLRVLGIIGIIIAVLSVLVNLASTGFAVAQMSNIEGTGPYILAVVAMAAVALAMSVLLLVASVGMTMRRRWGRTWGLIWAWSAIPGTVLLVIAGAVTNVVLMDTAHVSQPFQVHVLYNIFSLPFAILLLAMLLSGRIGGWARGEIATAPTSAMAVWSLLLAFWPPIIGQIASLILGCIARRRISRSNGALGGKALATAGVAISSSILGMVLLLVILGVVMWTIYRRPASASASIAPPAAIAKTDEIVPAPADNAPPKAVEPKPAAHPAAAYAVVDLGTLGGSTSVAYSVNQAGQVVGYSVTAAGQTHAFLFAGQKMTDLGGLGGSFSRAYKINDAGQIVGVATTGEAEYHAFKYAEGAAKDLGKLAGTFSAAYAIASDGKVVGESDTDDGRHAFINGEDKFTDLGAVGDDSESVAYGVNAGGLVVGGSGGAPGPIHAFLRSEGETANLGALSDEHTVVIAYGINDSGKVVGVSGNGGEIQLAFLYADKEMTPLGTLGGPTSAAYAINSKGAIVGQSQTLDGSEHAFVCKDGTMTDLNGQIDPDSGWTLHVARDINASGQIVGWGTVGGHTHAFLLTPKEQ